MQLDGIHHLTCITADARSNVDFYTRVLGLRLVKRTVNFDAPELYHLYYGDERGTPGSILTFFEFPGAKRGRAGAGMIHRLRWRVASKDSLEFWSRRLREQGLESQRMNDGHSLCFADPEGLELELSVQDGGDDESPLASLAEIPTEHALRGFIGVRAYVGAQQREDLLLIEALGFRLASAGSFVLEGARGRATYVYDDPPAVGDAPGAGTVHHIAWCSPDAELEAWRERLVDLGARPTGVIDRQYFRSIYFRAPHGVLFELATPSPGFAIDEEPAHLGESLCLPPQHEHLRARLERALTPLLEDRG